MNRNYRNRKTSKPKNRIVAAIMAFFLGGFGAHKFYLGQTGQGIMFFFIFMITLGSRFPFSFLLGVMDSIRLLTMSDEKFHHKYNRGAYVNPTHRDSKIERRRQDQLNRNRTPTRVAKRAPTRAAVQRANPFKKSGIKKYKDFDLDGAIIDFNKGLEINPQDVALHFNIANAYSLTEQKEKAYHHLAKAVEMGFSDTEMINAKDDLAFVRIQPEWDTFKANGYKLGRGMMAQSSNADQPEKQITDDVLLSQLNKLAELRKKGLLSEAEFALERRKLMSR